MFIADLKESGKRSGEDLVLKTYEIKWLDGANLDRYASLAH